MADTENPVVMRNIAPQAGRFRKLKTDLRDCMLRIHREFTPDGVWSETDDAVLDAVTAWAVDVADRGKRPDEVPAATRAVQGRL